MNDGRETYVQFDIFLFPFVILLNIVFEISINPSLTLYQKFYSLSLMKSIHLKDRDLYVADRQFSIKKAPCMYRVL